MKLSQVPARASRQYAIASRIAVESLRLTPSRAVSVQLFRSLIVSAIALVFDFSLLVILKQGFGINYLVAATLSFIVGVSVNYALSVVWVFPDHKLSSKHAEMAIFLLINIAGLGLNLLIIAGLVEVASFDYRFAKAISTIVVFFWNFILRKKLLY